MLHKHRIQPLTLCFKFFYMNQNEMKLPSVNPHAAGIDLGSRTHYVAVGQSDDDVKRFGCYTSDLYQMSDWLKQSSIKTVAIESKGSYWKGVFRNLQSQGFEVLLVNGKYTRNVKNKKTDPIDCRWIQRLHSLGLLSGSFLPDEATARCSGCSVRASGTAINSVL